MDCDDIKRLTEDHSKKVEELFANYSMKDDDLDPELFEQTLFEKLENVEILPKKPQFNYKWLAVAAVFAFLLSVSFASYLNFTKDHRELISSTTSAINEPIRIIMEYESDFEHKDVKVFFKLEEGVEFYSENEEFKKMKSYAWKGDLKKGVNQIPFVVKVTKEGKWMISTDARFSGNSHKSN